jgi:hypothetical protein
MHIGPRLSRRLIVTYTYQFAVFDSCMTFFENLRLPRVNQI